MSQEGEPPIDPIDQQFWDRAQQAVDEYRAGDIWAIQRYWPSLWTAARAGVIGGGIFWAIRAFLAGV